MSKRTNKRTNRNKKNYRKKKTKNRRVNNYKLNKRTRCLNKKYIGGEGKDEGQEYKQTIRAHLRTKENTIRTKYEKNGVEQDALINEILEREGGNTADTADTTDTSVVTGSLKLLENEWNKILEDKESDMKARLRERLQDRVGQSVYTDAELDILAKSVGLLTQSPMDSKKIEGRLRTLAKKAKDTLQRTTSVQQSTGDSEKSANDAEAIISDNDTELNTQITAKVRQIFTQDLQKEKIKLIIEYSHDETLFQSMISKEGTTGAMLLYNIIGENASKTVAEQTVNSAIFTNVGSLELFVIQFIYIGIALAFLCRQRRDGQEAEPQQNNYGRNIRIIYCIMLFLTLLSIIILFIAKETVLVYFIVQLAMFLIGVLRTIFVEYGIITAESNPTKSRELIHLKTKQNIGYKITAIITSPVWGLVIAFDYLMKKLINMIINPLAKKMGAGLDAIINKIEGINKDRHIDVNQEEKPGGGKLRDSINTEILERYMSIQKLIDLKMTPKIKTVLLRFFKRLCKILGLNEIKFGGYGKKKRGNNKKRRYKTKRK